MSDDTWWIEFMEDEVEPSLRLGMEKMLRESNEDHNRLENMARLRQWIKESDPSEDLWRSEVNKNRLNSLQEKIMSKIAAIDEVNSQPRGSLPPSEAKPPRMVARSLRSLNKGF